MTFPEQSCYPVFMDTTTYGRAEARVLHIIGKFGQVADVYRETIDPETPDQKPFDSPREVLERAAKQEGVIETGEDYIVLIDRACTSSPPPETKHRQPIDFHQCEAERFHARLTVNFKRM